MQRMLIIVYVSLCLAGLRVCQYQQYHQSVTEQAMLGKWISNTTLETFIFSSDGTYIFTDRDGTQTQGTYREIGSNIPQIQQFALQGAKTEWILHLYLSSKTFFIDYLPQDGAYSIETWHRVKGATPTIIVRTAP